MDSLPDRPAPTRPIAEVLVGWIRWFGVGRLVLTACTAVAVAFAGFWLLRAPPPSVENTLPFASTTTEVNNSAPVAEDTDGVDEEDDEAPASSMTTSTPAIVVYVAGAVVVPGVYEFPQDARIGQAIDAAGGLDIDADIDNINLAGFMRDGDRVYIPRVGIPVPTVLQPVGGAAAGGGVADEGSAGPPPTAAEPVDLNRASADQLDQLPGIGPSTAAAIVAHRESNGPFASVDELLDVRGIGPAKLDTIRDLIAV